MKKRFWVLFIVLGLIIIVNASMTVLTRKKRINRSRFYLPMICTIIIIPLMLLRMEKSYREVAMPDLLLPLKRREKLILNFY